MNAENSAIMSDIDIKKYVAKYNIISPFIDRKVNSGKLSYGLNSSGYDVRMQNKIMIAKNKQGLIIDPCQARSINKELFETVECNGEFVMPPHSFILGLTVERVCMPDNVQAIVIGKSTYARCGIFVNVTSIENGADIGHVVLEIANLSCNHVKIYTGEDSGICKFVFLNTGACMVPYSGRYSNQKEILIPGRG